MTRQQEHTGSYADGADSAADSTTPEDTWAPLPEAQAALWRALDAWQDNFGHEAAAAIRRAKAAIAAGKIDTLSDPRELLRAAQGALETLARPGEPADATAATLAELARAYWQRIAEQRETVTTGLASLDKALNGGLQPQRLMILLGAPGKGKTTLANQIAEHVANAGRPVVYVTMEDPSWALLAKTVARIGDLDYGAVMRGQKALKDKIDDTLATLNDRWSASRLLYIEQSGRLNLATLRDQAAAHFARYGSKNDGGPGLLVVDYLQRAARATMPGGVQSELRLAVSALTDQLRDLARALDCTVLALGSQNRGGYGNGASALASAKESGDIEYSCDVLAAIGEMSEGKRTAPLNCQAWALNLAKNRQGDTCTIQLDWRPTRQQFTEVAQ